MKILIFPVVGFLLVYSCNSKTRINSEQKSLKNDSLVSFFLIRKDSIVKSAYKFKKFTYKKHIIVFSYSNLKDTFSFSCDTNKDIFLGKFNQNDTVRFEVAKTSAFTINNRSFTIVKLLGNKDIADGAFAVFFSKEFGFLFSRSNTWRSAQLVCNENPQNIYLSGLLYDIFTEDDFSFKPTTNINPGNIKVPKAE